MGSAPRCLSHAAEIPAFQILHHDVRRAVRKRADIDDSRDVLALDLHRGPRFPSEAGHGLAVVECLRQEKLQRHFLVELHVMRGDDHAHAPGAENSFDPVFAGEDVAFPNACR